MKAKCGDCGTLFDFTPNTETHREHEITFAQCECGRRYFSTITNEKIRERIDRTQTLEPIQKDLYVRETRHMMKELEEQEQQLISEVIG